MDIREHINDIIVTAYMELTAAVREASDLRKQNGLPEAVYPEHIMEFVNILKISGADAARDYIAYKTAGSDTEREVYAYKRKTGQMMKAFRLSEEEIEENIRQAINNELLFCGIDAEIGYVVITGPVSRGAAHPEEELNVMVEYRGKVSEEDMKDFADDLLSGYEIEGRPVNIMWVKEGLRDIGEELSFMEGRFAPLEDRYKREMAAALSGMASAISYKDIRKTLTDNEEREDIMEAVRKKAAGNTYEAYKCKEYLSYVSAKKKDKEHENKKTR